MVIRDFAISQDVQNICSFPTCLPQTLSHWSGDCRQLTRNSSHHFRFAVSGSRIAVQGKHIACLLHAKARLLAGFCLGKNKLCGISILLIRQIGWWSIIAPCPPDITTVAMVKFLPFAVMVVCHHWRSPIQPNFYRFSTT